MDFKQRFGFTFVTTVGYVGCAGAWGSEAMGQMSCDSDSDLETSVMQPPQPRALRVERSHDPLEGPHQGVCTECGKTAARLVKPPLHWPTGVHQVCVSGTICGHREKTSWV